MNSIYFRHFLMTSLMILLSFLVLGSSFLALTYQYVAAERERQLDSVSYYLADYSVNFSYQGKLAFDTESYLLYTAGLKVLSSVTTAQVMTVLTDGTIVACSDGPGCEHVGKVLPAEMVERVISAGSYRGVEVLDELNVGSVILVGRPILGTGGTVLGAVFSLTSASAVDALVQRFLQYFLMAALVVLIISGILSFYVSRKLALPLTQIARAAREFAMGNFETRIPAVSWRQDEINQLALAFNAMAESMEKSEQLRRDFIANVSHELRTPMTTIGGYVDGVLDGTIPPERQTYYLQIIRDEVRRMNRLVVTMLEIARMQSGNMTLEISAFDIGEQCSRTALNLEERITAKQLDMVLDLPRDTVMVRADRDKITQVLSNLLDNAVKFAQPGTPLVLRVTLHGGKVHVSVQNHGPEISPQDLPHVFDRFHKADRSRGRDRGGLGLGLYIVKTILSGHGESIWVESANGITTFTFTLKVDDSRQKLPGTKLERHSSVSLSGRSGEEGKKAPTQQEKDGTDKTE